MFKKFHPKEDVSGSTSLKSSVQRHIRTALLEQYPLLSQPAYREQSSTAAASAAEAPAAEEEVPKEEVKEEVEEKGGKKKGGKGKGGGGGGKKGGKGKDKKETKEDDEDEAGKDEGEVLLIDGLWPKKEALGLTKWCVDLGYKDGTIVKLNSSHDRISIYTINSVPLFFNHFDGPFIPTLKLLHQYPALLPHVQIDRGAIKFLLAGANMMAPGLLSAGGSLPDGLAKDALVAIHAEGKDHACGIGKMAESSADVKKAGKGVAVEVLCWIGDDLWKVDTIGL